MPKRSARRSTNSHTLGFAFFIGALIALLILVAIGIKIFLLFRASSFDGKHQFSLEIQEPNNTRFVVFNPEDDSIHTLLLHGSLQDNPMHTLGIPVDGKLVARDDLSVNDLVTKLIFDRSALHVSTTIIDGINLFVFAHTANQDETLSKELSLSASALDQDTVFSKIFLDASIYKEGKSVAVVNATGVSGLGSGVARLLQHLGVNVVSVTTASEKSKTSQVQYVGETSYTLFRLSQLFHFPQKHLSSPSVSDITLVLGEDFR